MIGVSTAKDRRMTSVTARKRPLLALLGCLCLLLVAAPAGAATSVAPAALPAALDAAGGDEVGAGAPYAFTTRDFRIPVSDPDLFGDPVTLDARLLTPVGDGPFAGLVINHGYLGDKGGDGGTAEKAARAGYVVLRYSSRGFGDTKGQVNLVGPQETRDLLQAIDWLNDPSNVPTIWVDHIGHYGGSYGGAHGLSLAAQNHPAIRAIVPAATWTDLSVGLLPNKVLKLAYLTGFYGAGRARTDGYDNYDPVIDTSYAKAVSGADLDGVVALLKSRSVVAPGRYDAIRTPIFLVQGLNDGLFDGNEAIDAYNELSRRGVPVRLYLGGIGHPPARSGGGLEIAHVESEVLAWLDHYVRGVDNGIERAAPVEFALTQYFDNPDFAAGPEGVAARARAAATTTFGAPQVVHLCGSSTAGTGTLSATACPSAPPLLLAAGTGGQPASEPVGGALIAEGYQDFTGRPLPESSTPVDVVTLDGPVLPADTTYAGVPTLAVSVLSDPPTTGLGGPTPPAAAFQLVPKVYDVAPDGTATLITRGAYAEQPGEGAPGVHTSTFDAFALAHTFPAGHRLRLTLSSADSPYLKPNPAAFQVLVLAGSTLRMPGAQDATLPVFGAAVAPAPVVPEAPVTVLLPLLALGGLLLLRRRRAA